MRQLPAYSDWGLHAGPITGPGTCFSITGAASGLVSIREAGRTTPQQLGIGVGFQEGLRHVGGAAASGPVRAV